MGKKIKGYFGQIPGFRRSHKQLYDLENSSHRYWISDLWRRFLE